MTKEFKQIEMRVGEKTTMNFKRGFEAARAAGIKEVSFYWGQKRMRTSDEEFVARVLKILPNFTHVAISDIKIDAVEHGVILTSEDGF